MDYPWYQVVKDSDSITQGDIIKNCYIPLPNKEVYSLIINPESENFPDLNIITQDVIIMSQACDIANNKINSIVVCPIWPLACNKSSGNVVLTNAAIYFKLRPAISLACSKT